jgi:two-component system sensor histidine kinase ChiS
MARYKSFFLKVSQQKMRSVLYIIEENPDMQELLRTGLQNHLLIYINDSAESFIRELGRGPRATPDAILIASQLPGLSGTDMLPIIRSHEQLRNLPVILMSKSNVQADREEAFLLGADDYLVHPFSISELQIRLLDLLHSRAEPKVPAHSLSSKQTSQKKSNTQATITDKWKTELLRIIEEHLDEDQVSASLLARKLAVSERQLFRLIKEATGFSPIQLVQEIRLQKAKQILSENPEITVADVARLIGISNPGYFACAFKRRFKISPSKIRRLSM